MNGVIERNDAYLLARANLDMVRFMRELHVTTPDHRNHSTDCTLEITVKLSTREGTMETNANTQVFFEFSSEKTILSSQLRNTVFDAGELVTTYDNVNNLFGGIVKAENHDGSFQVRSRKSQIEASNVGFSMIQVIKDSLRSKPVVTPLFMYSPVPRFPSALRVTLTPNADMVLKNGHSPQLTANFTESYATCQDPPVTNNIMLVFRNDYTDVQGKEESFSETITKDLTEKYQWIKIKNVRLAPGSILVYFDVITQKSRMKSTLVALWEMVKSGYTLRAGDTEYQAKPVMRVDGQDYHGNDVVPEADDNSKFTVGAIVGACVAVTVVVIGAAVCFCYKKRIVKQKERFKWKSESKVDILDSRSTSRMSDETRDHEMVLISGLSNDHFQYSDDDASQSPDLSARNSFPLISQPEEKFAKRKLRKVDSASSQTSNEAWTESSSPALVRHQLKLARHSPLPPASSFKPKVPSPLGQLLSKQTSDSQFLIQENSSTEGSPLNLSPQAPKRGQSPNKRVLVVQDNLTHGSSDSSDEELGRSNTSSPISAHTCGRKSLTPQIKGSKLKDHSSEAFIFEKAVLYKRMKPHENGSQRSCKLDLLKS